MLLRLIREMLYLIGVEGTFNTTNNLRRDWTEVTLPSVFAKLISITMAVKDHTTGKITDFAGEIMFATSNSTSLTTTDAVNITANGLPKLEDLICSYPIASTVWDTNLDLVSVSGGKTIISDNGTVMGGQSNRKIYIGMTSSSSNEPAFTSAIQVNESNFDAGTQTDITVDGVDIRTILREGDVLHAHDDAVLGDRT